jgi:hypothetical protein
MADGENDAAGRQVANLLAGLYSYTPVAVAIVELGIPALLAGKALTVKEVASAAGTAPDATARRLGPAEAAGRPGRLRRGTLGRHSDGPLVLLTADTG